MSTDGTNASLYQPQALMRIPEVADRLKLGRSTVYKLIQHGVLHGVVHVGRAIRVRSSAVDDFIDKLPELDIEEDDTWQLLPRYVEDVRGATDGNQSSSPAFRPLREQPQAYRRAENGRR